MRNFEILFIKLVLIPLLGMGTMNAQKNPSKKSVESFYNVLQNVDWSTRKDPEGLWFGYACEDEFYQKVAVKKLQIADKNAHLRAFDLPGRLMTDVTNTLKDGSFDDLKEDKTGVFADEVRDKLLVSLAGALSFDDFVSRFTTKRELGPNQKPIKLKPTDAQKENLRKIYDRMTSLKLGTFLDKNTAVDKEGCKRQAIQSISLYRVMPTEIVWNVYLYLSISCDCDENSGPENIDRGSVAYHTLVTSKFPNDFFDLDKIIFKEAAVPTSDHPHLICCPSKEEDETPKDKDGGQDGEDKGNNDGGDGKEDDDDKKKGGPKEKDKDCCYEEQAGNSIGFFPIIALNDNFDNSGFGIGIEYLHGFGTSFGNNQWYAGLQGQYLTESSQDGELTTNTLSAAVILENRTSILPCTQWVQRVCGQYENGTIEAFGNKDDFSGFTVGVHTGFNFDVSPSVSIGADATVLTVGKRTLKPANGNEIEQDIGSLAVGQQNIRLGLRFKF